MEKRTLLHIFEEDFIKEMRQARSYPEAYEKATAKFEEEHGFEPFPSYDAFRMKKKRLGKKKI